jgi:NAD(P)-dependent dehydrogenase (short-subunit alcohol dehydrogenase family)
MGESWTAKDMPNQSGRVAVVTGANSGLGREAARALALAGADVVLACRDVAKGEEAASSIRSCEAAAISVEALDLASLESVRDFAERLAAGRDGLDLLINNAGVMAPRRSLTADGFELQLGTNHLGHFALTGQLLGLMEGREDARVVTVSSTAHRYGRVRFDDLQGERHYRRWRAYCQSKLANLLFALELDRRLRAAGSTVSSLAAHPGYAATNLQSAGPPALDRAVFLVANRLLAQGPEMGSLPELYAATRPHLDGGLFVGPDGYAESRGYPRLVPPSRRARNPEAAARLWEASEALTGVHRFVRPGA